MYRQSIHAICVFYNNKYQLSLMNLHDVLHYGKHAAKRVDAQCDKPATELS